MTSSMPAPRIDLAEDSPITQRIASSTFDLPQPLGPTTPVRPGSIRSSAGSTKLLKPDSFSRLICMSGPPPHASASCGGSDQRLEGRPGVGVGLGAVDEEGRRAVDARRLPCLVHMPKPVDSGLVGEALLAARGGYARP